MLPKDNPEMQEKKSKTGGSSSDPKTKSDSDFGVQPPSISLPKGGGAIKNIDEHFQVNAANGTSSFSLTLPASKSRSDFGPALSLSYNSGSGNGCFGLGWSCQGTSIQRRTGKQIPQYRDAEDSDIFQFTGLEDLVPGLKSDGSGNWISDELTTPDGYLVKRYRPRLEGSFDRIERITAPNSATFFWKVTNTANVVTIFGRSTAARICDPADPQRIFRWLPEFCFDDKGNCMEFTYATENLLAVASQLHEQNRLNLKAGFSNAYLQTVQYGNCIPYYLDLDFAYNPLPAPHSQYLFSIVFDFGDHDLLHPTPAVQKNWSARWDAFSDYRAGFEIRTYRICQRILFFNNFKELNDGKIPNPVLVRSLDLQYRYFNNPLVSVEEKQNAETDYIITIQQTGYKKSGSAYSKKSLPPITFTYQEPVWNTQVQDMQTGELMNAPVGIGDNYQWLDLRSEGISGILTEQGNSWYYKSNFGDGRFSAAESIIPKPSFTGLSGGRLQLQDLEADGRKFIVSLNESFSGYFELTDEGQWLPFQSFANLPNINPEDGNLKWIDLNGDGRPDIIISEENVFTWFANAGRNGYEAPETSAKPYDEEQGPALVFRDPVQSIFLADMSGDGLTDIVRIRNAEVCYWPNMGYGKFGAKINMTNAPFFDNEDSFNPSFIHLADINGTGASDILYLGKNNFQAWMNLSGNAWSDIVRISDFPNVGPQDKISVIDLLGNGTACIVWSSPLPNYSGSPMRYIDLLAGMKPFILSSYSNNLGKQVSCMYTSSTSFYIQDKLAGNPWITKLPFPVQCVSQLMMNDLASGLFFSSLYSYHHGYYDHAEKEFRGFGRVEQTDTEDFSNFILSGSNVIPDELQQPPVKTITWYHTGAYFNLLQTLNQFEKEYNTGPFEFDLPLPTLPAGLTPQECREALRSCKGMMLRQEVYALDGTSLQESPYSVGKNTWQIRLLQPSGSNQYAVFFSFKTESAQFSDERIPDDPRI